MHRFYLLHRNIIPELDQVEVRRDGRVKYQKGVCISFPIVHVIALSKWRRRRTRAGAGGHVHTFLGRGVAHNVPESVLPVAPKEEEPVAGIQEDQALDPRQLLGEEG